ncbi:peptidoglycan endopeptidase RipA [Folsomia candida]|uniref:peptidoglycan endopeptidase RipA n=1 Tax=Folsomia candida TaxID=158441 RepID=UPI000B8F715D|nr:peptidoglycan endopeptidase RipA [Folsomia candida]
MISKVCLAIFVATNLAFGYVQEDPCKSYPGVCKPKIECPQGSLAKINGRWSCPSSPDGIECCPSGGGGYKQEEPCTSYPGVCKPSSECPRGSLAKINGQYSCPSSPNGIECCPTGDGGGGGGGAGAIVAAARRQIGQPYVWGGGNKDGPTNGGFDCSGLSQYAVYQGVRKVVPRTAQTQYDYGGCASVPLGSRQAGDLIFWGNGSGVYHVAIVSGYNTVVYAPQQGERVKEGPLYNQGELKGAVRRCW